MYQSKLLQKFPNLRHGFSTKAEGNQSFTFATVKDVISEEVVKNREEFLAAIDPLVSIKNGVRMRCRGYLPGKEIVIVENKDRGRGMEDNNPVAAQALVTKEKSLFLFLCTADCLPVILYEPEAKVIALVHASWLMTKEKLVSKVVNLFLNDFGAKPERIMAAIGPGVHKESYRLTKAEQEKYPEWESYLERGSDGMVGIDLPGFNNHLLLQSGVKEEHIDVLPYDTGSSDEFFSFYRQSHLGKALDGEIATVIGMS